MTSLPRTYRAAVFESVNSKLTVKDVELKMPRKGQVLVKVLATGVCHSDCAIQAGVMGTPFPRVPGHEIIGNVAAVGEGELKWKVGDRVGGAWHGGHDQACRECQRGLFQMCKNEAINGATHDGGYAQYVLLQTEAVARVPTDVDPAEYAPMLCAGVTVFNSIRRLKIESGELIAIQGLGGLGHLAVQYAHKMGYRVAALSSGSKKKDFALQLGADVYIDTSVEDPCEALQKLGGAACVVATAPHAASIAPLTGALQPNGTLLVLAATSDIPINTLHLIRFGIKVTGWPAGHALDCEEAIAFAKNKNVKCMIEKFKLEDAQEALEHMMSGNVRFRAVLVMD